MTQVPAILILAAGTSSRMRGSDKLLELIDGEPQLTRIARSAAQTGAQVFVTLPPDRPDRSAALVGLNLTVLVINDASEGMAASVRAGAVAAASATGLMILPADMPELDTSDLTRVIEAFGKEPSRIWRATTGDGQLGHPVIFPASAFAVLADLIGDSGARQFLTMRRDRTGLIALPDQRAVLDLDTPEDWDNWRCKRR